jgi:hypothetical protein
MCAIGDDAGMLSGIAAIVLAISVLTGIAFAYSTRHELAVDLAQRMPSDLWSCTGTMEQSLWYSLTRARYTRAAAMLALLVVIVAAVFLTSCQPGRFNECDPTDRPGVDCNQKQGRPYLNP